MMEPYPQWKEVIELLTAFFAPIFEGVLKDEVFLGDWMPELGRYLEPPVGKSGVNHRLRKLSEIADRIRL